MSANTFCIGMRIFVDNSCNTSSTKSISEKYLPGTEGCWSTDRRSGEKAITVWARGKASGSDAVRTRTEILGVCGAYSLNLLQLYGILRARVLLNLFFRFGPMNKEPHNELQMNTIVNTILHHLLFNCEQFSLEISSKIHVFEQIMRFRNYSVSSKGIFFHQCFWFQ